MGRLWDKWMGTLHADGGAEAIPTQELRAALLALDGTGVPFSVREAGGGVDLLAEWKYLEPATGSGLTRKQVERTVRISMCLLAKDREVRAMDEQWEVTRAGPAPGRTVGKGHGKGPVRWTHKQWHYEKGPDGSRQKVESFNVDITRDMKDPLRKAVLGAGWTWRGVYKL
ncbi:hypothetical protein ACFVGY_26345 [Streptomyces sp. NPDC127106]|uniref:hypothetical protein n=1 Tax=Streptomyces sp. NPDC127106 TaxID=3345360 RepID=UPI00362CCDB4